ncbi:hypothetical protein [Streptomyces sp. NBC_01462]|uniref:hypothetical protein n=1 Tax=Streptomyces sp. NBC_01462 TaxID=2903876 RepID=UPI002E37CF68|nr:hypothetical protein [Streptomyces sp. NBC_01462]
MGVVFFKRLGDPYQPAVQGWLKYTVHETTEAIAGPPSVPRTLLPGRYDDQEPLQYIGRTTTLPRSAGATVAGLLTAARARHPRTGWSLSARWGSQETLDVTLVELDQPGLRRAGGTSRPCCHRQLTARSSGRGYLLSIQRHRMNPSLYAGPVGAPRQSAGREAADGLMASYEELVAG